MAISQFFVSNITEFVVEWLAPWLKITPELLESRLMPIDVLSLGGKGSLDSHALQFQRINKMFSLALTRLGTGKKILKAADDPSGTVSTAQLANYLKSTQAAQFNTQTAFQLTGKIDTALKSVSSILNTIKENLLSMLADDSLSDEEKLTIQAEIDLALLSMASISEDTTYDDKRLLDSGYGIGVNQVDRSLSVDIFSANFSGTRKAVNIDVEQEAKRAEVQVELDSTGTLSTSQTIGVEGTRGRQILTLSAGLSGKEAANAINAVINNTGVQAAYDATSRTISFKSLDYGRNQFVKVDDLDGTNDMLTSQEPETQTAGAIHVSNQFVLRSRDLDTGENIALKIQKSSTTSAATLFVSRDESSKLTSLVLTVQDAGDNASGKFAADESENRSMLTTLEDIQTLIADNAIANHFVSFELADGAGAADAFLLDQNFVARPVEGAGSSVGQAVQASYDWGGAPSMHLSSTSLDLLLRANDPNYDGNTISITIDDNGAFAGSPIVTSGASSDIVVKIGSALSPNLANNMAIIDAINNSAAATFVTAGTNQPLGLVSGSLAQTVFQGLGNADLTFRAVDGGDAGNQIAIVTATSSELLAIANSANSAGISTEEYFLPSYGVRHVLVDNTLYLHENASFSEIQASLRDDPNTAALVEAEFNSAFADYTLEKFAAVTAVTATNSTALPSAQQAYRYNLGQATDGSPAAAGLNLTLVADNTGYAGNSISISVADDTTDVTDPDLVNDTSVQVGVVGNAITATIDSDGAVALGNYNPGNSIDLDFVGKTAANNHEIANGYTLTVTLNTSLDAATPSVSNIGQAITVEVDDGVAATLNYVDAPSGANLTLTDTATPWSGGATHADMNGYTLQIVQGDTVAITPEISAIVKALTITMDDGKNASGSYNGAGSTLSFVDTADYWSGDDHTALNAYNLDVAWVSSTGAAISVGAVGKDLTATLDDGQRSASAANFTTSSADLSFTDTITSGSGSSHAALNGYTLKIIDDAAHNAAIAVAVNSGLKTITATIDSGFDFTTNTALEAAIDAELGVQGVSLDSAIAGGTGGNVIAGNSGPTAVTAGGTDRANTNGELATALNTYFTTNTIEITTTNTGNAALTGAGVQAAITAGGVNYDIDNDDIASALNTYFTTNTIDLTTTSAAGATLVNAASGPSAATAGGVDYTVTNTNLADEINTYNVLNAIPLTASSDTGAAVITGGGALATISANGLNYHNNQNIVDAITASIPAAILVNASTPTGATNVTGNTGGAVLLHGGGDATALTYTAVAAGEDGNTLNITIRDLKDRTVIGYSPTATLSNETDVLVTINSGEVTSAANNTLTNIINEINAKVGTAGSISSLLNASTGSGGNIISGTSLGNTMSGTATNTAAVYLAGGVDSGAIFSSEILSDGEGVGKGRKAESVIDLSSTEIIGLRATATLSGEAGNQAELIIRFMGNNGGVDSVNVDADGKRVVYTVGSSNMDGTQFSFQGFAQAGGFNLIVESALQTAYANQFDFKFNDAATSASLSYDTTNKEFTVNYVANTTTVAQLQALFSSDTTTLDSTTGLTVANLFQVNANGAAAGDTVGALLNAGYQTGILAGTATPGAAPTSSTTMTDMLETVNQNSSASAVLSLAYHVENDLDATGPVTLGSTILNESLFSHFEDVYGDFRFSLNGGSDGEISSNSVTSYGQDGILHVNGTRVNSTNGLNFTFQTPGLSGNISLKESFNEQGRSSTFYVEKDGSQLQISPRPGSVYGQAFPNVNPDFLGLSLYYNPDFNSNLPESASNSRYTSASLNSISSSGFLRASDNMEAALKVVDRALEEMAAHLGAINALAGSNLSSQASILDASSVEYAKLKDVIENADLARESFLAARDQILLESSAALAAQANLGNQSALYILGGLELATFPGNKDS